jgi:hypothetical protein
MSLFKVAFVFVCIRQLSNEPMKSISPWLTETAMFMDIGQESQTLPLPTILFTVQKQEPA